MIQLENTLSSSFDLVNLYIIAPSKIDMNNVRHWWKYENNWFDFNRPDFQGFVEGEDILVDTGVLLAFYNPYDAYYSTVNQLFDKHILHNDQSTRGASWALKLN